ncbi:MAG: hypothetical protein R2867_46415 [Caldilineaceae bacterium]
MTRFIIRSIFSAIITMLVVSLLLFFMVEYGRGDVTVKILGIESTAEQRASYRNQLGLNQPAMQRYFTWLLGNDWWLQDRLDFPLASLRNQQTAEPEWWAVIDGEYQRWQMDDGELLCLPARKMAAQSVRLLPKGSGSLRKMGLNNFGGEQQQHGCALDSWWKRNSSADWQVSAVKAIVLSSLFPFPKDCCAVIRRIVADRSTGCGIVAGADQKTGILALLAFVVVMPLALLFGIIAA